MKDLKITKGQVKDFTYHGASGKAVHCYHVSLFSEQFAPLDGSIHARCFTQGIPRMLFQELQHALLLVNHAPPLDIVILTPISSSAAVRNPSPDRWRRGVTDMANAPLHSWISCHKAQNPLRPSKAD
jgi:hypothetical protein